MALFRNPDPMVIEDSNLTNWNVIGSGGFGQIYKARHQEWCCDVAIKLLHYDDGNSTSLLHEVDMMRQASSPYVIQVLGVFKGRLPSSGLSTQLGLVMEYMERGTLATLQKTLCGTPPWPLVFRLAHQVALGINFLHRHTPPLLHLDLKPSNVLLDSYLNAKLTDFGLARFYHSVTRVSKKDREEEGGTISYMPPEAFELSYSPTRASDIYSYGILLWSIVTGKQPYANAMSSMVRFRIPQGDRPSLDEIMSKAAGLAGLTALMDLMKRCWDARANQRPTSRNCTTETEELYKMHKHAIHDAVHQVLKKLDEMEQQSLTEQVQRVQITQTSASTREKAVNYGDNVPTGRPPVQEMAGGWPAYPRDTARVKGKKEVGAEAAQKPLKNSPSPQPGNVCDVDHKLGVSSVHPIQPSAPFPSTGRPPQGKTAETSQLAFRQNSIPQYHRLHSSPDAFLFKPPPPARGVHIHLSNVVGFQQGNNNTMFINAPDALERKRHPTAPSRVDVPPPHSGNRWDKTGGVG